LGEDQRLISPRYWSNLPAGEVFTTPATVDGRFVLRRHGGRPISTASTEICRRHRWCWKSKVRGSSEWECARKGFGKRNSGNTATRTKTVDRVGELAFGTNLGLVRDDWHFTSGRKVSRVHIAFGDPYGSQTHADWKSRTHVDVLTRDCDVWIDEDQIIEKGHYQLEHLGLA